MGKREEALVSTLYDIGVEEIKDDIFFNRWRNALELYFYADCKC